MKYQTVRPHAVSILAMSKDALAQSLNEAWDEIERLRTAAEKAADIVGRNLYHQREKVADVPALLRDALYREFEEKARRPTPKTYNGHVLFQTGDSGAPEQIKDRNGEVVLQCCKLCGSAETELSETCSVTKQRWDHANGLGLGTPS